MVSYSIDFMTWPPNPGSQVLWPKPAVLGDTRQHTRADFRAVVKRENEIGPTLASEHLVRTSLALHFPADANQRGENEARFGAWPFAHAALKVMLM